MPIRLVLANAHLCSLTLLENLLLREPDFHVVARCQSGEETLHAVRQHCPEVLILDLRLRGQDGLQVLRSMHQERLRTRIVLLTTALNKDELLEAMLLGVEGVVPPERMSQQLVSCIRKVHAGDRWLERCTVGGAVETLLRREVAARTLARGLSHQVITDSDLRRG